MKVLFLDWKCFMKEQTINALNRLEHKVVRFFHENYQETSDLEFSKAFSNYVSREKPEICFSYNYYPSMAEGCKEHGIPYVSLIYDSPYVYLYSYTLAYPTNYVFLFDRSWVNEFNQGGLKNVYYSCLPADADRIQNILKSPYDKSRTKSDISFVGNLYNEGHNFYERFIDKAPEYLKGYLEGIIEAQQKLYGVSIVEDLLTDNIVEELYKIFPADARTDFVEPKGYRYSEYIIKRKITQVERIRLLTKVGELSKKNKYNSKLFTSNPNTKIDGMKNMGIADYNTEMSQTFHDSKINLNITLRSIKNGIPLRCMDIMANGGFLLSNYQSDLCTDFISGEEFDFFGDPDEMLGKIEYYMSHEKERKEIARNGQDKVRKLYSFEKIFSNMFDIAINS